MARTAHCPSRFFGGASTNSSNTSTSTSTSHSSTTSPSHFHSLLLCSHVSFLTGPFFSVLPRFDDRSSSGGTLTCLPPLLPSPPPPGYHSGPKGFSALVSCIAGSHAGVFLIPFFRYSLECSPFSPGGFMLSPPNPSLVPSTCPLDVGISKSPPMSAPPH